MSMPKFPERDEILPRDIAIDAILTSIAAEEMSLSHIINAEGEKIQYVLSRCADISKVLEVNESITNMLDKIIDLQIILKSKMQLAKSFLKEDPVLECIKECCCTNRCC